MARGGARARSGPAPDPRSGRSEARGLSFRMLDPAGYEGKAPSFPIPSLVDEQGKVSKVSRRERQIWRGLWKTPQAIAWVEQSWRWRMLAEYCRLTAMCELDPNAAMIGQLHRYRDQLGLSPAGLKENGWLIGVPASSAGGQTGVEPTVRGGSRARLRAVHE